MMEGGIQENTLLATGTIAQEGRVNFPKIPLCRILSLFFFLCHLPDRTVPCKMNRSRSCTADVDNLQQCHETSGSLKVDTLIRLPKITSVP